jgi:hypothetical protein
LTSKAPFDAAVPAGGELQELQPELVDEQREALALARPGPRPRLDLGPEMVGRLGEEGPGGPDVRERLVRRRE